MGIIKVLYSLIELNSSEVSATMNLWWMNLNKIWCPGRTCSSCCITAASPLAVSLMLQPNGEEMKGLCCGTIPPCLHLLCIPPTPLEHRGHMREEGR